LLDQFGLELEYMIVDAETLDVLPVADRVLAAQAGEITGDVECGAACWSNELVLHVIELKTNGPVRTLAGLPELFAEQVRAINAHLAPLGGRLMPSAMHPWMDPLTQTRLWPHENSPVYEAFNRIFGCQGHGWSNLQSMHINLPFEGDEEFGRLHAGIRLILPILPALAASSPFVEGRATGLMDNRLSAYRTNCAKIPSLTGNVIPEPVFQIAEYKSQVLERCYRDLAPHDPEGILQDEWVNARGAIARFHRNTIEIRLIDVQESPLADVAVASAVIGVIRALIGERWCSWADQCRWETDRLAAILDETTRAGGDAIIAARDYAAAFGMSEPCTGREFWARLVDSTADLRERDPAIEAALAQLVRLGPLAGRIARACTEPVTRQNLHRVYTGLCDCLDGNRLFMGAEAGAR